MSIELVSNEVALAPAHVPFEPQHRFTFVIS